MPPPPPNVSRGQWLPPPRHCPPSPGKPGPQGSADQPGILPRTCSLHLLSLRRYYEADQFCVEDYCGVLGEIAAGYKQMPAALQAKMKKTPFLPAYRIATTPAAPDAPGAEAAASSSSDPDGVLAKVVEWELVCARDCYLIDNTVLQRLLHAPSAPDDLVLRQLYSAMEVPWLSQCVERQWEVRGQPSPSSRSAEVQAVLRRRHPLLTRTLKGERRGNLRPGVALGDIVVLEVPAIMQVHCPALITGKGGGTSMSSRRC